MVDSDEGIAPAVTDVLGGQVDTPSVIRSR
jgi:hypothetical protein